MTTSRRTVGLSLLHLHNWSGTGFYSEQVLEALLSSSSDEFQVVGLRPKEESQPHVNLRPHEVRSVPSWRLRWPYRALADWIGSSFGKGIDLLHYPSGIGPPTRMIPVILTLHDVSPFLFPQFFPQPRAMYLRLVMSSLVRSVHLILADSHWQAEKISQVFPMAADRIRVLYPTCASVFWEEQAPSIPIPLPEGDFLLCVGTIEPRKNLAVVLENWKLLPQIPNLVFVGRWGWMVETFQRQLSAIGTYVKHEHYDLWRTPDGREIRRYEFLPTEQLAMVYQKALGLVYPSFFEGFGLPVLESLVCGCPILTGQNSPMEEIAGPAGWYFDPWHPESLRGTLEDFLNQPAERKARATLGQARQAQFSPQSFQEGLLRAYREVG